MRHAWLALVAVLLATLTACTGIATSGPIEEVPMSAQPPGIDVAPEPPQAGITPSRLVEGFLQAMADPEGDYAVARQYLTSQANDGWQPIGAVVYDGSVTGDADEAAIDGMAIGELDAAGHYAAQLRSFEHDFGVVRQDDEWRIGVPPGGLLLSRYIFERYYSEVTVYYMSTTGTHVVPDPIHPPESKVSPTSIIDSLLDGPSDSIARAVSNAVPVTVKLGDNEASIDPQGVVTVDLTGLSSSLGDDARRRIGAQLLWSLTSIPRVTGLAVTRDGLPFTLPDSNAQGVLELATQQGYQVLSRAVPTPELFAIRDGVPGRLSETFEALIRQETRYSELAVSLDGGTLALIDETRTVLSMGPRAGQTSPVTTAGLSNLRRPQFVLGALWLLGDETDGTTRLIVVQRGRDPERVAFDEVPGSRIEGFAVSPTGARAAIILSHGQERSLGLGTVLSASPVRVVGWRELELIGDQNQRLSDVQAVTWSDETLLGLIGTKGSQPSVFTAHVDGSRIEDLGPSGSPVDITALARQGGGPIAIRTDTGSAWRYDARTRWHRLAENISSVAYGG